MLAEALLEFWVAVKAVFVASVLVGITQLAASFLRRFRMSRSSEFQIRASGAFHGCRDDALLPLQAPRRELQSSAFLPDGGEDDAFVSAQRRGGAL